MIVFLYVLYIHVHDSIEMLLSCCFYHCHTGFLASSPGSNWKKSLLSIVHTLTSKITRNYTLWHHWLHHHLFWMSQCGKGNQDSASLLNQRIQEYDQKKLGSFGACANNGYQALLSHPIRAWGMKLTGFRASIKDWNIAQNPCFLQSIWSATYLHYKKLATLTYLFNLGKVK